MRPTRCKRDDSRSGHVRRRGMKAVDVRNRSSYDLSVVLAIAISFALFILAISFAGRICEFFRTYDTTPIPKLYSNLIFLWLTILVWLTYRRWHEAVEYQKELEMIIDSISPDVLMVIDSERRIRICNKSIERMFGYDKDEILNRKTDFLYFDRRTSPGKGREIHRMLERDGFHIGSAQGKRKDGGTVPLEIITGNLKGRSGAVLLLRDITERKRAEEELLKANAELESRVMARTAELTLTNEKLQRQIAERKRAEKEKLQGELLQAQKMEAVGTLAGGVAHDFNNLLTNITGYTELSMRQAGNENPLYGNLQRILAACRRASDLVHQLLLFSRRQPMELAPMDINHAVDDMVKMLERIIGEDITVKVDLRADAPIVCGDKATIEQAIMNLAVNTRDAMPKGGCLKMTTENVTLDEDAASKVSPEARPGEFLCISVEDSGTGMVPQTIEHIFEPFFTTKEPGKGTGLGLSVVYGIVKEHNGWVTVSSTPDKGSTFKVYLPLCVETGVDLPESAPPVLEKEPKGLGEHILLVEDEKEVRDFAARVLRESGYVVFTAASAKEALDIFAEKGQDIRLVFSDVVLTDKPGPELVEALVAMKPDLHILLSSGYPDEKSQWAAIRRRGLRFIQKPYGVSELIRTVREAVEGTCVSPAK